MSSSRYWRLGQPWLCFLGFHRWRLSTVCARWYTGAFSPGPPWEVYEECARCGDERSYYEHNKRRGTQLVQLAEERYEEAERVRA